MPKVCLICAFACFFPMLWHNAVPFLECESCIRHGVTLVYTSSVRQAITKAKITHKINAYLGSSHISSCHYKPRKEKQKNIIIIFIITPICGALIPDVHGTNYITLPLTMNMGKIKFRQQTNLIIKRSVFVQGHIQLQYDV